MNELFCEQCERKRAFDVLHGMPISLWQLGHMCEFVLSRTGGEPGDNLEQVERYLRLQCLDRQMVLSWLDRHGIRSDESFVYDFAEFITEFASEFIDGLLADMNTDDLDMERENADGKAEAA